MICAALVNRHTDRRWPAILLAQPVELTNINEKSDILSNISCRQLAVFNNRNHTKCVLAVVRRVGTVLCVLEVMWHFYATRHQTVVTVLFEHVLHNLSCLRTIVNGLPHLKSAHTVHFLDAVNRLRLCRDSLSCATRVQISYIPCILPSDVEES